MSLPGILVVRTEPRWMGTLCDSAHGRDLLERVDALALRVNSIHQMHLGRSIAWSVKLGGSLGRESRD